MIRDPSDGSVRETITAELLAADAAEPEAQFANGEKMLAWLNDPSAPASGLPDASTKPERQARLERSREWLKAYHQRKNT